MTWYNPRIDEAPGVTVESIDEFCRQTSPQTYMWCRELSKRKKWHYHFYLSTDERSKIEEFCRPFFEDVKNPKIRATKWAVGEENKVVDPPDRAENIVSYMMKCKVKGASYKIYGMPEEVVEKGALLAKGHDVKRQAPLLQIKELISAALSPEKPESVSNIRYERVCAECIALWFSESPRGFSTSQLDSYMNALMWNRGYAEKWLESRFVNYAILSAPLVRRS